MCTAFCESVDYVTAFCESVDMFKAFCESAYTVTNSRESVDMVTYYVEYSIHGYRIYVNKLRYNVNQELL